MTNFNELSAMQKLAFANRMAEGDKEGDKMREALSRMESDVEILRKARLQYANLLNRTDQNIAAIEESIAKQRATLAEFHQNVGKFIQEHRNRDGG